MANEQFNENIKIEEALSKVDGDEQYKNTLKKTIRDYLGYSNYVNQMNQMPGLDEPGMKKVMGGGVEQSYLRGNIKPGGVRSLVGSGIGLRNQEMGYLKQMAKSANSGNKKKSAEAAKNEYDLMVNSISDSDDFGAVLKTMVQNPINQDGTFKTPDQMKQELAQYIQAEGFHTQDEADKLADQMVNQTISPEQQQNFQTMYYESLGYTENEAENLVKYDRYARGDMSESESQLYETTDPGFAERAEMVKNNPGIQNELNKIQSNDANALTFRELKEKYPNVSVDLVKPVYERAALDDIQQMAQEKGLSAITTDEEGGQVVQPLNSFLEAQTTQDLKKTLSIVYQGALTPNEIDYLLYQYYLQETGQQATQ